MSAGYDLPPEIIKDILIRLPAKSLSRFTCVSKNWCSLICSPQFIKTHLHLNKNHETRTLFLTNNASDIVDEPRFPRGPIRWDRLIGSCNGLVLAVTNTETLYLMNPTTKKVSELPYLYFYAYYFYGFGYDSSCDDYKVVMLRYSAHETEIVDDMFISVYSLRNNSWRNLQSYSYDLSNCDIEESGVFVNGNLHWLVETSQNQSPIIIAFCLANEELAEIELPENENVCSEPLNIGGKLGLYANNDLWVMEEYGDGKSWTKVSIHRYQIVDNDINWDLVEDAFLIYYRDEDVLWRNVKPEGLYGDISVTYVETLETPY